MTTLDEAPAPTTQARTKFAITGEHQPPVALMSAIVQFLPDARAEIEYDASIPRGAAVLHYTGPYDTRHVVLVVSIDHPELADIARWHGEEADSSIRLVTIPDHLPWLAAELNPPPARDWATPATLDELARDERQRDGLRAVLASEQELTGMHDVRDDELTELTCASAAGLPEVLDVVDQAARCLVSGLAGDVGVDLACREVEEIVTALMLLGQRPAAVDLLNAHLAGGCGIGVTLHEGTGRDPAADDGGTPAARVADALLARHHAHLDTARARQLGADTTGANR